MDTPVSPPSPLQLDTTEARTLGVLIEKSFITPDNYPLSLNALTNGCNQLTGRDPVLTLTENAVQDALTRLTEKRLAARSEHASGRVSKYEHTVRLRFSVTPAEQALLALLLLRGPQTPGELRARSERMHAFAHVEEVDAVLAHLAEKNPPLVTKLARAPGTKEARFAQTLSPLPIQQSPAVSHGTQAYVESAQDTLSLRITQAEAEIAALKETVEQLKALVAQHLSDRA